jgi:uncharacterized protein (TIGR02246 family)
MSDENKQRVRHAAEVWNSGDVEAFLALFHDDAVFLPSPGWPEQGRWEGTDAIRGFLKEWLGTWDEVHFGIRDLDDAGDSVAAQCRWTVRGARSGAATEMDFSMVFTARDDLFAEVRFFDEHREALKAVGLA